MSKNIDDWRTGRHVVYKLHAHIVLVVKYRRDVMTDRVSGLLKNTFEEVCARFDTTLDICETDRDHVHLLVTYPPKIALSTLVMSLKTNSSKRVRAQHWPEIEHALWKDAFWSPSYCVISCGDKPLETVRKYVENQRLPNRKGRPPKTV